MTKKAKKNLSIGFLFDDTLDSSDGVAQYVKTLGAWLSAQGHEVSYLVGETKLTEWANGKVYSMAKNHRVVFNGNRLSIPMPADKKNVRQVLTSNNFDVLHVQVPYSPFMSQRVINAADYRIAIVGTFHVYPAGWLPRAASMLLRSLYGASLQRIDPMLAVSQAAAAFAKESYGLDTQIVPNVVEIDRFKPATTASDSTQPTIVFLGRLVERKGCMQLLKAFKILSNIMPDVRLVIGGDGPERSKLEKYANNNGLAKSINFLGFVDEADKPKLLASADIACFPSLYGESFGIVLIEAMAAGAGVVIGGNNPGYRSVLGVKPELLFDPNDSELFANKLEFMLKNPRQARRLHAWQQQEVKKYDVKTVGPQIIKAYAQAIAKNRLKDDN